MNPSDIKAFTHKTNQSADDDDASNINLSVEVGCIRHIDAGMQDGIEIAMMAICTGLCFLLEVGVGLCAGYAGRNS